MQLIHTNPHSSPCTEGLLLGNNHYSKARPPYIVCEKQIYNYQLLFLGKKQDFTLFQKIAGQLDKVYSFISCLPGPKLPFCKLFPWSQQHSYCWWWLRQQISVSFQPCQCFPSEYRLEKIITILTRTNELHIRICNHILM